MLLPCTPSSNYTTLKIFGSNKRGHFQIEKLHCFHDFSPNFCPTYLMVFQSCSIFDSLFKILLKFFMNLFLPAFSGLGTPPTKTVFLGSKGSDASKTKSASLNLQGLIWTGLSFIVGLETHKYNLSSSWIHASINACTEDSSCNLEEKI